MIIKPGVIDVLRAIGKPQELANDLVVAWYQACGLQRLRPLLVHTSGNDIAVLMRETHIQSVGTAHVPQDQR